jgi:DNA-binding SARP family transcriptional activator/tetratricopeptide (TPR) repeat protein
MRPSFEPPERAAADLRYRILGPLEVIAGERPLNLGGLRPRRVLAALLLNANRPVSLFHLVEAVWEGAPPNTARRQVQNAVAALRAVLSRVGAADAIVTHGSGYLLRVDPDQLDSLVFERLVERARALADGGDAPGATAALREALALWRGPVLAGLGGQLSELEATRLDEKRLVALEEVIELELAAGGHARLVSELRALVAEHPLRERFAGQLMVALYRGGRQAEALAAYHDLARHLHDELGLDPGPPLRRTYEMVLREDPELNAPAGEPVPASPGVPAQLPVDAEAFTGREGDLARLNQLISDGHTEAAVVITAIAGIAGVGKTALAVHWAHQVRDKFPDGQLYVNLHGYSPGPPVRPIDALAHFLRSLGVPPGRIPTDQDEAAAMYRSLLADRRVLVMLDNARSPEQVRPLLPGNRECLVLVTSRDQLGGLVALDGARRLTLDVLAANDAVGLLGEVIGARRVAAEPAAAEQIARDCGYLPLALRIASANLHDLPGQRLAAYAERLAGSAGDEGREPVRGAFELSHASLPEPARRMFRLLGLVPGPDVTPDAAAALADMTAPKSAEQLAVLANWHLIDEYTPGRFAFHDLLRTYATQLAAREGEQSGREATRRLYDYYLRGVDAAARALYPVMVRLPVGSSAASSRPAPGPTAGPAFGNQVSASRWLDAERPNLVAAIANAAGRAAGDSARPVSWLLADALRGYFWLRMYTVDWQTVGEVALEAAEADGDARAAAAAHLSLGLLCHQVTRHKDAIEHYTRALALSRQSGWAAGESAALANLGNLYVEMGRLEEAVDHVRQSLALDRSGGDPGAQAVHLTNLGFMYVELGRLTESLDHSLEALALYRGIGARASEPTVLGNIGVAYHLLGRFGEAFDYLSQAVAGDREPGHTCDLAWLNLDAGRVEEAGRLGRAALAAAREGGRVQVEAEALNVLGAVEFRLGRSGPAIEQYQQGLRLARDTEGRWCEAQALIGLSSAYRRDGDLDRAAEAGRQAVTLTRTAGFRVLEGLACAAVAAVGFDRGDLAEAAGRAEEALALHTATGHRTGEARVRVLLGRIRQRAGDEADAQEHWRAALDLLTDIGSPEADEVRALSRIVFDRDREQDCGDA